MLTGRVRQGLWAHAAAQRREDGGRLCALMGPMAGATGELDHRSWGVGGGREGSRVDSTGLGSRGVGPSSMLYKWHQSPPLLAHRWTWLPWDLLVTPSFPWLRPKALGGPGWPLLLSQANTARASR